MLRIRLKMCVRTQNSSGVRVTCLGVLKKSDLEVRAGASTTFSAHAYVNSTTVHNNFYPLQSV